MIYNIFVIQSKLDDSLKFVSFTSQKNLTRRFCQLRTRTNEKQSDYKTLFDKVKKSKNLWEDFEIILYEKYECENVRHVSTRTRYISRLIGTMNENFLTKKEIVITNKYCKYCDRLIDILTIDFHMKVCN